MSVIQQDVTDPQQDGLVLAQDPTHGKVQQGSTVTITVGHLVTAPATHAPTTTTDDDADTTTTTTTPTTTPTHDADDHADHDAHDDDRPRRPPRRRTTH